MQNYPLSRSLPRKSTSVSRSRYQSRSRYIIESIIAYQRSPSGVSTTAITISNVLRVQSQPRVPSVSGRERDQPTMVFIAVNLVSLRALHRTQNLPPLISRLHLRRSFIYADKCTDARHERRTRIYARACACDAHVDAEIFQSRCCRYYLSEHANYTPYRKSANIFPHARTHNGAYTLFIGRRMCDLSFVKKHFHVNKYLS